jgi:hypothetical protein
VITTVVVTLLAFVGAFSVSADSQLWVAGQIGVPAGVGSYGVVLGIDAPLLAFSLGAIARRSRGESAASSWVWICLFSTASIALNSWHGISVSHTGSGLGSVFVILVSSLMPLAVLGCSEQVVGILVAPPAGSREQRQALARVADRGALPAQTVGAQKPPKRGTPADLDLRETARALAQAEPGITKAEIARRTGLNATGVREALNS